MLPTFLQPYAKAVVCVLGVVALVVVHKANVTIPGLDSLVLDFIIGTLASFGVYQVQNK